MPRPLQKRDQNGNLYIRSARIEAMVDVAVKQNVPILISRASIVDGQSADFLDSECLVYLIRDFWRRDDAQTMSVLLPALLRRCEATLNAKLKGRNLPNIDQTIEDILGEFSLLFLEDGTGSNPNQLDYFECRFNSAFWAFRTDHLRRESAVRKHTIPLPSVHENEADDDASSEEILYRLSQAFDASALQQQDAFLADVNHQGLLSAIDALPQDERNAVILCHIYGYKVESLDASEITAATLCKVSGRTIRSRLADAARKLSSFNQ